VPNKTISQADYDGFRQFLEQACGIVLGDNKHYLISSRLTPLMTEFSLSSLSALLGRLKADQQSGLRERVIDAMTTNETSWFRDTGIFDLLKKNILPELSKNRTQPISLWSAACSSGQEPYSISMAVQEFVSTNLGRPGGEVQILATDISPSMLSQAAEGRYDPAALARGLSEERKQRYFVPRSTQWEVKPEIKKRVRFRELNLLKSYQGLGRFDIIFCRNVLIYFSQDIKRDILARATALLNPGGYLLLGSAESLTSHSESFEMLRFPEGILYRLKKKPDSRPGG
jgi:chemotaxis protein methyltransferase CheR